MVVVILCVPHNAIAVLIFGDEISNLDFAMTHHTGRREVLFALSKESNMKAVLSPFIEFSEE